VKIYITTLSHIILLATASFLFPNFNAAGATNQVNKSGAFFADVDTGRNLSPNQIYPRGRIFPFMGYSGKNAEDAAHGFTVGGPHYGTQSGQKKKLSSAKDAGLPFVYGIGLEGGFTHKPPLKYEESKLRKEIQRQVLEVADDPGVVWWYVRPEEIRCWRRNELEYLKIVTETIRASDPYKRPIWMYEPNNRTAESLKKTGQYLDIIGKGTYVNLAGFRNDRIWVRWSLEQEVEAAEALKLADGRTRTPIVMPELCRDPDNPAQDSLISTWIRHDIYLGLLSGAKGVAIWSLFPRGGVRRTFRIHYNAYAAVATELTGPKKLGEVFLFGKHRKYLTVKYLEGPKTVKLFTGPRNKLEAGTLSKEEQKNYTHIYPSITRSEIVFQGRHYLFLCNSSQKPITCSISSFPEEKLEIRDIFNNTSLQLSAETLECTLPPWNVYAIEILPVSKNHNSTL
jgi:hypothetical protein